MAISLSEQRALWDALQVDSESRLAELFEQVYKQVAERYGTTGNPLPPDELRRMIEDILRDTWERSIRAGGEQTIQALEPDDQKAAWPMLERKEYTDSFWDQLVRLFIEQYGSKLIVAITEATRNQIRRIISVGEREGLGLQEIADRLQANSPELSAVRAHTIARTEVHGAAMYGGVETAKASRIPLMKVWQSVDDHRTRSIAEGDEYDHVAMHDQTVKLDEPFMVQKSDGTKEPLSFPGDPAGSAASVINCRCAMTYKRRKEF